MRDAPAGTSFLQSHAEMDHRDQTQHQHHNHHLHNHMNLHQRQLDPVVTDIISTVSVIQEILVDQNGSTFGATTLLAGTPTVAAPADPTITSPLTDSLAPLTDIPTPSAIVSAMVSSIDVPLPVTDIVVTSTDLPIPSILPASPLSISPPTSQPTSTSLGSGSGSGLSLSLSSSSGSLPPQSFSTSQATPVSSAPFLGTNSTSSTTSSPRPQLLPTNLSNYTASLSNLLSSLESSTSDSGSLESSTLLSSVLTSTESSNPLTSPTSVIGGIPGALGGPGVTSSSSTSTSTSSAGATGDSSSAGAPPSTPAVVGGVVGSIAGIVFIVALLMVIVRWRKRQQNLLRLGSGDSPVARAASTGGSGGGPSHPGEMTELSLPFAIPASLASLTGYKRASHPASVGASSSAGSEVGFYKVSGRKLPSVLQHGGDGFGDAHDSLSGSSFYRDSRGFYGGPGSPISRAGRESGVPITRPSPARTPVISEGAFGPPSPVPLPLDPPRRPDGLGRSHPSRDGSRGSRFTEEV